MADLILELFSEEIPAKIQENIAKLAGEKIAAQLKSNNFVDVQIRSYITPRRLTITIENLPTKLKQSVERIKGPKVDAHEKAIAGFLEKHNLQDVKQLEQEELKGVKYYMYQPQIAEADLTKILTDLLNKFILDLANSWPKTMRWGTYDIKWIRPLKNILCLFDGQILPVSYGHLKANDKSFGHRFLSDNKAFKVTSLADYLSKIAKKKVVLDQQERKARILESLTAKAKELEVELQDDPQLLAEVTGLVEYPEIIAAEIKPEFLILPEEVLITTLKNHQKYFCTRNKEGQLTKHFLLVSNNIVENPLNLMIGNQRVVNARLADAEFFWQEDISVPLNERVALLRKIIFHKDIGDLAAKTERNKILAKFIAVWVPQSNIVDVELAAHLAKTDLTTDMVSELPELQGIIGYYYAKAEQQKEDVALAIRDHYLPQGLKDHCPSHPLSIVVALADKIDSLVSLFLAGEKPSGSKDPFALRRTAISIIRIILQNHLNIELHILLSKAIKVNHDLLGKVKYSAEHQNHKDLKAYFEKQILDFLIERFKIMLKDQGLRHDVVSAIFDEGKEDNLLLIQQKSWLLQDFINRPAGQEFVSAFRRADNISRQAMQEDGKNYVKKPHLLQLKEVDEKILYHSYKSAKHKIAKQIKQQEFAEAFKQLQEITEPLHGFFDNVQVNVSDENLKQNRLKLLASLCKNVNSLANFSKIEKSN